MSTRPALGRGHSVALALKKGDTSYGHCRGIMPPVFSVRDDRVSRGATRRTFRTAPASSPDHLLDRAWRYEPIVPFFSQRASRESTCRGVECQTRPDPMMYSVMHNNVSGDAFVTLKNSMPATDHARRSRGNRNLPGMASLYKGTCYRECITTHIRRQ